ncbi:MAG: GNAT family N-acetyltransferase [Chthonomonadales bacterium]|nr:GNAT family N-acetyltransferase [Chthonomonadales bacterium]
MSAVIRLAHTPAERQACIDVRMRVFVEEQGVPVGEEIDAQDEEADHFLVDEDDTVVGTARLVAVGAGVGKIGRVALLPEVRGRGIGRDLMWYVMGAGFRRFAELILDAQLTAIRFYERLGFEAEGPVFLDAGIEHRRMRCAR